MAYTIWSISVGWLKKQNEGEDTGWTKDCPSDMVNGITKDTSGVTRITSSLMTLFCVVLWAYGFLSNVVI